MSRAHVRASARGAVGAGPEEVFAFLADLHNHWRLAARFVSVEELEGASPSGAWIRLHGPLGLSRLAHTAIVRESAPAAGVGGVLVGRAEVPNGTRAHIVWSLSATPSGTDVTLELEVEPATPADRLLLALGGRRWLEGRLLAGAVADLGRELPGRGQRR
jgi:hypothetical protein